MGPVRQDVLNILQHRDRESSEESAEDVEGDTSTASVVRSPLFRLGRGIFGGILAFMAIDNLRNLDERIAYAESKGAPMPEISVPAVSSGLLLGSVGVALWRLPSAAAAAVAWFFVSVTPIMHDFWNLEDPERKQQQFFQFLKNTAILGAAIAFLKIGRRWSR